MKNRSFRRLFASYVALMAVILFIVGFTTFKGNVDEMRLAQQRNDTAAAEDIAKLIDANMGALVKFAGKLHNMPWVHKLYPNLKSLNDTYTVARKREIIRDLALYSDNDMLIEKLFIIYPYRDTCIATNMWTNIRTYFSYIGLGDDDYKIVLENIKATKSLSELVNCFDSKQLVLCAALENIRQPRAYICFFIDRVRLTDGIKMRAPDNMMQFSINRGGETLMELSSGGEAIDQVRTISSGYLDWEYEFKFASDLSDYGYYEKLNSLIMTFFLVFLAGLVFSWGISAITYRPVTAIIKKLASRGAGFERGGGDYAFIERTYDKLIFEYDGIMRANVIRRLLQGNISGEEAADAMAKYRVPFSDTDYYQVYLIGKPTMNHSAGISWVFDDNAEGFRYEICDTLDGDIVLITAYPDESAARQADTQMRIQLGGTGDIKYSSGADAAGVEKYMIAGQISQGVMGISASYKFARDKYEHLSRRMTPNYYPMEWEKQFITGLQAGNYKAVSRILSETVHENQRRTGDSENGDFMLLSTVLGTMYRAIDELHINNTEVWDILKDVAERDSTEDIWNLIDKACFKICETLIGHQDKKPTMEQDMLLYVEENFGRVDLSLNLFADTFGISSSTVNKLFKQSVGDTFFAYLSKVRLEKAKTLLAGGSSIHSVAEMTGYTSEASFRRAFIRYAGVSPREYSDSVCNNST